MAIVEGQIEPLKRLKKILDQYEITRFNSIGEINEFIRNYESERLEISKQIENALEDEIINLQSNLTKLNQIYEDSRVNVSAKINVEINALEEKYKSVREKCNKSLINKILFSRKAKKLIDRKTKLENNHAELINKKTEHAKADVNRVKSKLDHYINNKDAITAERCEKPYKRLVYTKDIVEELYPVIAGAIGENLVVKEIQKLPDNYYLFNDYSIDFNPPIYNKRTKDRIFSIQIDHLLICESGIYILETKNWSRKSIKELDLRSPVKQILRTSYALFVLLNSESTHNRIKLDRHHWGDKQIPIRNIVVMINYKPNEAFKHVKVLSLNELNGYLSYFDPIFNSTEVESIYSYLRMKMN